MREYQLEGLYKMMSVGLDLEKEGLGKNEGLITVNIFNPQKHVKNSYIFIRTS